MADLEKVLSLASVGLGAYSAMQNKWGMNLSKELNKSEIEVNRELNAAAIKADKELSEDIHNRALKFAKDIYEKERHLTEDIYKSELMKSNLMHVFDAKLQYQSHIRNYLLDLHSASRESERDMYEQVSSRMGNLLIASSIMFAALCTLLFSNGSLIHGVVSNDVFKSYVCLLFFSSSSFGLYVYCISKCLFVVYNLTEFMSSKSKLMAKQFKQYLSDHQKEKRWKCSSKTCEPGGEKTRKIWNFPTDRNCKVCGNARPNSHETTDYNSDVSPRPVDESPREGEDFSKSSDMSYELLSSLEEIEANYYADLEYYSTPLELRHSTVPLRNHNNNDDNKSILVKYLKDIDDKMINEEFIYRSNIESTRYDSSSSFKKGNENTSFENYSRNKKIEREKEYKKLSFDEFRTKNTVLAEERARISILWGTIFLILSICFWVYIVFPSSITSQGNEEFPKYIFFSVIGLFTLYTCYEVFREYIVRYLEYWKQKFEFCFKPHDNGADSSV